MATYKKRGGKPRNRQELVESQQTDSTTAEVFNTLDETASKSERWIEKNSKVLFGALVVVVGLFLAFLAYSKFVKAPNEETAANELAFPRKYFDQAANAGADKDSLLVLALEGADGNYGFVDIAETYSGTTSGNLANYYAGVSYLQLKNYEEAIAYLDKFKSDDEMLAAVSQGAIGDAFSDINQPEEALSYYEKAAKIRENEFTTPLYLFKAGQTAVAVGKFDKAVSHFEEIKEKYPKSQQGQNIDKYINLAKYAEKQ